MKKLLGFVLVGVMAVILAGCAGGGKYEGYLFAYFEGGRGGEALRFAVSRDAVNWYALNQDQPIIPSADISESGGIRDPHIIKGGDGWYYIVATDMNTEQNGWGSNPGIVMMRSKDLIEWEHSYLNLSHTYPDHFGDAHWVWAPQSIWDSKAKKQMVYFTLRRANDQGLVTYYAYANKDFTGFESEPQVLFDAKYGSIDNDIIYHDGKYHLFYKGNTKDDKGREFENGIQQAVSETLTGGYVEDFIYLDAYAKSRTGVEGSSVFPLNDGSGFVLMYDVYGEGRYEFQTSKDLYTFTADPQSFTKDFNPRHGSVISLTGADLKRVQQNWGFVLP